MYSKLTRVARDSLKRLEEKYFGNLTASSVLSCGIDTAVCARTAEYVELSILDNPVLTLARRRVQSLRASYDLEGW